MTSERSNLHLDGVAKSARERTRKRMSVVAIMFGAVFALLAGRFVPPSAART
jgi:hypothetical protein